MKLIGIGLIVVGLSIMAFADNCYVHDVGSPSWVACKEQAGDSQARMDAINQNLVSQIQTSNSQAQQTIQSDELARRLLLLMQQERALDKEGQR